MTISHDVTEPVGMVSGGVMEAYIKTIKLSESGHADLIFFKNGKTIFIEVKKSTGGVSSELQLYRQKQFQNNGFIWEFCNNLDQFKKIILYI